MKKDILAKAIRLADKSSVRAGAAVMASPKQIKAPVEFLTHRLYTRIKPSEFKRLTKAVGKDASVSTLLRDLLLAYISKTEAKHGSDPKKK